jgi:Right handed beta helix region
MSLRQALSTRLARADSTRPAFLRALAWAAVLCVALLAPRPAIAEAATWTVTPSFHAISLYYGPVPSGDDPIAIQYRRAGTGTWKSALGLHLDRTAPSNLAQYRNQYRGSILNLSPNTAYELQYRKGSGEWTALAGVTTRTAQITGTTVPFSGVRTTKLVITEGGSPGNWRIYDGQGSTIDPDHRDNCVEIDASYVVLKNFVVVDCKFQAIVTTKPHIVISNNDISDWGEREVDYPSAGKAFNGSNRLSLASNPCIAGTDKRSLARADDAGILVGGSVDRGDRRDVVIERNRIHDPRFRATRWEECANPHPYGSRAIYAIASKQLVIRYNTIFAANNRANGAGGLDRATNRYYDAIYASSSQDVDIYCNIIASATDDLIEADNYAVNVRIFGNYFDNALDAISHQSMQVGPAYIFRNVFDRGAGADGADYVGLSRTHWAAVSGRALKISLDNGNPDNAMFTGPLYVIHNTMLRTDTSGFKTVWSIVAGPSAKWQHDLSSITSMNNVFMSASYYLRDEQANSDYVRYYFADLHNQGSYSNPFVNYRMSGSCGDGGDCGATASWLAGHGPATGTSAAWPPTGRYKIANTAADGVAIADFNGAGNRTRGAHGSVAAMQFGPDAHWDPGPID